MRLDAASSKTLNDQRDELAELLPAVCVAYSVDTELATRVVNAFDALDPVTFNQIQSAITGALEESHLQGAYLDVSRNIVKAMRLYLTFLDRNKRNRKFITKSKPNRKILDIGSGSGSLSFLCNALGHEATGLDVPWILGMAKDKDHLEGPLNSLNLNYLLTKWYGVQVIEHGIKAQVPLAIPDDSFDDFAIFYPTFHRMWKEQDWDFLFSDLIRCATKNDSILYLRINTQKMKKTGRHVFAYQEFAAAVGKRDYRIIRDRCYVVNLS